MFLEVELTNFRQHRSLTVNFFEGVNAIRGLNEKGKTSLIEGITYACFGARVLRESLAETVTWGEKDSSLKVRLLFDLNGINYTVVRSKSGASISSGEFTVPLASGQDEVKKYIENLFGTSAETASRMMLASQKSLLGALEDGPGAAVKLIETLANFSLLDNIITLALTKLTNGSTSSVSARVGLLEGQLGDEPQDPTVPLAKAEKTALRALQAAQATESKAREAWADIQPGADTAEMILKNYSLIVEDLERAQIIVKERTEQLAKIVPVPGPDPAKIAELRKQVEDKGRLDRARKARRELDTLPEPDQQWSGTRATLQAALDDVMRMETDARETIRKAQIEYTRLTGMLIKESACAFCGKDLKGVPEVVQRNSALAPQIAEQERIITHCETTLKEAIENGALYRNVLRAGEAVDRVLGRHSDYLRIDHNFVPPNWVWNGPEFNAKSDSSPDAATALERAEAQASAYQRSLGQKQQAQAALNDAIADATALRTKVDAAKKTVEPAKATLDLAAKLSQDLFHTEGIAQDLWKKHQEALSALRESRNLYEQTLKHREAIKEQLKLARQELKDMERNNALIAKLRKVRPQIADELWTIVTASIGKYFSDIRGTPSKVTREDNDFRIDGRGFKGLSGSTQDAFGLAVRIALTKTFLPNCDFLALDEPAAAADNEREANMLGMIAASGFRQVLLVTHSDLSDSFASKVVQL